MNTEVCTTFDEYMHRMCHNTINMSWTADMQNGVTIYGDYERPGYEDCWTRFKKYCNDNKVVPIRIKLYMFGMKELVFFEDPNGLDGFSICRGCSRDQSLSGQFRDFQFLTVSLLRNECDYINVRKFAWPETAFEEAESIRMLTQNNIEHMIFKHDSEKAKHPEVQQYLNRTTV